MARSHYGKDFKLKISEFFNNGESQISIANKLKINKSIVSRLIQKYKATGTVQSVNSGGRPRKTSYRTDQQIVRLFKKDPFISSKNVVQELNLNISSSTVRKRSLEIGLRSFRPSKKPFLTKKKHLKNRSTSELPTRSYSIGSRLEHNKYKMQSLDSSTDSDTYTLRVRAFSVGSRAKISRCEVKRGKAKDSTFNKKHGSSNNINLTEGASNYQTINVNSSHNKKATSAPLLIHKSQNSFDRMSDLMEIDFSKSQKEISSSTTRCCPLSVSVPVTFNDQQKFKTFIISSNNRTSSTNYSSSKHKSKESGYLEMRPVSLSSNHSSNSTLVKNIVDGELTCISLKTTKSKQQSEPDNQNGVAIISKKIDELITDDCKCTKDTTLSRSTETDLNIKCKVTDAENFETTDNAQKNDQKRIQLKCPLENQNLCFLKNHSKNNNQITIKSSSNKNHNEITNGNIHIDFHINRYQSCQNEAVYKEKTAKYQLDRNAYEASNDTAKSATNYRKTSDSSIQKLTNKRMHNINSGYEILQINSETSLQFHKILQRTLSIKGDKQSPQLTVRPSSADSGNLLLIPSLLTRGRSALTSNTENENSSLYRTLSTGDSLNCFGNNSVIEFKLGQQIRKASRPPSISSERELHYASLQLPKFTLEEKNGTAVAIADKGAKNDSSRETLFSKPSKIHPQRRLTYAKISFDPRESSNNKSSKLFNSSKLN